MSRFRFRLIPIANGEYINRRNVLGISMPICNDYQAKLFAGSFSGH